MAGDIENLHVRIGASKKSPDFVAGHQRHHQVDEAHVEWTVSFRDLESVLTVSRQRDFVSGVLEHSREILSDELLVVDDENPALWLDAQTAEFRHNCPKMG